MKRLAVILPAYNEATVIGGVLRELKTYLKTLEIESEIIVVDDGSSDKTFEVAKKEQVIVLKHILNRGLGGALNTGLTYAKEHEFDFAITLDSDGQHEVSDISQVLTSLMEGKGDIVIGSRLLALKKNGEYKKMPWDRILLNNLSNIVTWILFQQWTSDSQSGFRGFNKKALKTIHLKTQGMEVSSEFFQQIKQKKLTLHEVPITVKYSEYSLSKGQSSMNSFNIGLKLLLRLFR